MKKLLATTAVLLTAVASNVNAANTQYNGNYALTCDDLGMTFSVGLGGAEITQTEGSIILDSNGATISVDVPMSCDDADDVSIDAATMYSNVVQQCHAFEDNDEDPWVAENLPCETIAAASTWLGGQLVSGIEPVLLKSLDMSVRRSGSWFWRLLGFDAVDYTSVTVNDQVTVDDNMLIDKNGKWGILDIVGVPLPVSGEFQGVELTGCGVTQVTTATGDVDVTETGNVTSAKVVVDQDAVCIANYGDTALAVDVSVKITAESTGVAQQQAFQ